MLCGAGIGREVGVVQIDLDNLASVLAAVAERFPATTSAKTAAKSARSTASGK